VAETQAYIEHRLRHVGWKNDPEFAPACFDLIHGLSGGIPRRINSLCNRLLLSAFLSEKHSIDVADVEAVADELNDELGPTAKEARVTVAGGKPAPGEDSPEGARGNPKLWHVYFEQVEDRIDRLERTVAAAVDLLYRLLHPDRLADQPVKAVELPAKAVEQPEMAAEEPAIDEDHPARTPDQTPKVPEYVPERAPAP
jgi:hypothetical protein